MIDSDMRFKCRSSMIDLHIAVLKLFNLVESCDEPDLELLQKLLFIVGMNADLVIEKFNKKLL